MDNKIIAIIVIGVVLVSAGGVGIFMMNKDSGDDTIRATGNLPVFGNANNDDKIDSKDIDLLNELIEDESKSRDDYPYLDANQDGTVDSSDVELVQNIIDRKECTIHYLDWENKVADQTFPVAGDRICINRYFFVELLEILGITDNLVLASTNLTEDRAGIYDLPSSDQLTSYVGGKAPTAETILESKANLVIADTWDTKVCNTVKAADSSVCIVYIDIYSYGNLVKFVEIVGLLTGNMEKAEKYADFVNEIMDKIEDGMEGVTKRNIAVVHPNKNITPGSTSIEVEPCSSVYLMRNIANVYNTDANGSSNRYTVDDEWVFKQYKTDFDVIVALHENYGTGLTFDLDTYKDRCSQLSDQYSTISIEEDGNFYQTVYFTITFGSYAYLPMVAHMLYPDQFSEEDGWDYLQQYWDDFTSVDVDVRTEGGWFDLWDLEEDE